MYRGGRSLYKFEETLLSQAGMKFEHSSGNQILRKQLHPFHLVVHLKLLQKKKTKKREENRGEFHIPKFSGGSVTTNEQDFGDTSNFSVNTLFQILYKM